MFYIYLYITLILHLFKILYVRVFFVFFFFKQKTAYEMRISDWSSDVCSSDLTQDDLAAGIEATAFGGDPGVERIEASLGLGKTFFRQFDRLGSGGSHTFSASKHDHKASIAQTDKRSHPRRR